MRIMLEKQGEFDRKEWVVYYLIKRIKYSTLERTCYALTWISRRLREYMLCSTTCLISKVDLIKYIFKKP
jgi:hypothetical protein